MKHSCTLEGGGDYGNNLFNCDEICQCPDYVSTCGEKQQKKKTNMGEVK